MHTAIVFINVEPNKRNGMAEKLANMKGISEICSVSSRSDLSAIIRINKYDTLADLVDALHESKK